MKCTACEKVLRSWAVVYGPDIALCETCFGGDLAESMLKSQEHTYIEPRFGQVLVDEFARRLAVARATIGHSRVLSRCFLSRQPPR